MVMSMTLAQAAFAQAAPGSRTYVGQDVFVASGQQIHNATCLFCSVQVEGDLTGNVLVLFGSLNVSGRVRGHATVVGGNAVVDSQARIGGDAVVLGGNAVYETDDSLSGSAYVLGGHLSRVSRPEGSRQRRVSLSPVFFGLLAVLALILLSAAIVPRVRRRPAVNQSL
jgi:carbonic anhydrase/acetyltransferase-like protein (isoleucine patch superfamily)